MIILNENLYNFSKDDVKIVSQKLKDFFKKIILASGKIDKTFINSVINVYTDNIEQELKNIYKKRFCYWQCSTLDLVQKPIIKLANNLNPIPIMIVVGIEEEAAYNLKKEITFTIPVNYISILYSISSKDKSIFDKSLTTKEKETIKRLLKIIDDCDGIVIHEITHWIDFTVNNFVKPKLKAIKKITNMSDSNISLLIKLNPKLFEMLEYYEINAQIHTINNLYNKYKKEWNKLTIFDVLSKDITLENVFLSLSIVNISISTKWIQFLIKRMSRENILGENMKSIVMSYDSYVKKYINEKKYISIESTLCELKEKRKYGEL